MNKSKIRKNKGISVVEVVVASAVILTGVVSLIAGFTAYVRYALTNDNNVQSAYLAEEGLEAMTFLRDKGWATYVQNLTPGTDYFLSWNGTYWATGTTGQYVDSKFWRTITLVDVSRDDDGRISPAGTNDPNTKFVTVNVAFRKNGATTTNSMSTYLTNIYAN